jgi:hypothetical protein
MRTLEAGDQGEDVERVQRALGIPADGDFGPLTETQVSAFQAAAGIPVNGEVGTQTWNELAKLEARKKIGSNGLDPPELEQKILAAIRYDPLFEYDWDDRGQAPSAYINGMALTFAFALQEYLDENAFAVEIAKAASGNAEKDALSYYAEEFDDLDMDNSEDGVATLRHLFVMLVGLGMRESSGLYYEGRDQSADNMEADTTESGLFQTSWNISSCSDTLMNELLDIYWTDPNGWLEVFGKGLSPTAAGLEHYGSGDGARYQFLAKYAPAFAVLVTALGLRKNRGHWGPVGRMEVELTEEADSMLERVQDVIMQRPAVPPEPQPDKPVVHVSITVPGGVDLALTVNGDEVL